MISRVELTNEDDLELGQKLFAIIIFYEKSVSTYGKNYLGTISIPIFFVQLLLYHNIP